VGCALEQTARQPDRLCDHMPTCMKPRTCTHPRSGGVQLALQVRVLGRQARSRGLARRRAGRIRFGRAQHALQLRNLQSSAGPRAIHIEQSNDKQRMDS
jgi:hypothetical protein